MSRSGTSQILRLLFCRGRSLAFCPSPVGGPGAGMSWRWSLSLAPRQRQEFKLTSEIWWFSALPTCPPRNQSSTIPTVKMENGLSSTSGRESITSSPLCGPACGNPRNPHPNQRGCEFQKESFWPQTWSHNESGGAETPSPTLSVSAMFPRALQAPKAR